MTNETPKGEIHIQNPYAEHPMTSVLIEVENKVLHAKWKICVDENREVIIRFYRIIIAGKGRITEAWLDVFWVHGDVEIKSNSDAIEPIMATYLIQAAEKIFSQIETINYYRDGEDQS